MNRLFMTMFAMVFALSSAPVFAHSFMGDLEVDADGGKLSEHKLLAKVIKRALFKKKLAEAIKDRLDKSDQTFAQKVADRVQQAVDKLKDKAQEQGVTIGDYVADTDEEVQEEDAEDSRQGQVVEKLKALKGKQLKLAFVKSLMDECDRSITLKKLLRVKVAKAIREALDENITTWEELKEEAKQMLRS